MKKRDNQNKENKKNKEMLLKLVKMSLDTVRRC